MSEKNVHFLAKLQELENQYKEIENQISMPEVSSNPTKFIALSKEQGKLRAIITRYQDYKKLTTDIEETQQILADPDSEQDMKDMAAEEEVQLQEKADTLFEELIDLLVMSDDAVINSIIMEIRAGTGGDEASLFVRDLYGMYSRYAESKKWKIEELDFRATECGGFREAIFSLKGSGVWAELGYEGGGHRVQRVPQTESQGRVHTSAVTVAVLPEPEELDVQIDPNDVLEHVSRAGGPGGQSVNKLNSAIKLEHVPTGITVSMREEKSQHKNRAKAWRLLRSRIYDLEESKRRAERDSARKVMIGSGDRSSKIRTYNFPQNRMTDHRINLSLYNLDKIIMGDMDEVVAALKEYDKQQRLKNF